MNRPAPIGEILNHEVQKRTVACSRCEKEYEQSRFVLLKAPQQEWNVPVCDPCKDRQVAQEAARLHKAELEKRWGLLEVPPLYRPATLDSWVMHGPDDEQKKQDVVFRSAKKYISRWPDVPPAVVFIGGPGTGKGHLAWSIVKEIVASQIVYAKVSNVPDLIRDLRESWGRKIGPTEAERLVKYREPQLLVVDEVSRHAFYGEPMRHLYDLVNYRLEWQRPTILTTNESPDGLAEIMGPALSSRLAGASGLWDFGSHDYRIWSRENASG